MSQNLAHALLCAVAWFIGSRRSSLSEQRLFPFSRYWQHCCLRSLKFFFFFDFFLALSWTVRTRAEICSRPINHSSLSFASIGKSTMSNPALDSQVKTALRDDKTAEKFAEHIAELTAQIVNATFKFAQDVKSAYESIPRRTRRQEF
jgi:hypothetical protein